MINKLTIFLLVLILFTNCTKKQSDLEFEQEVFYEVFPKILDSVYRDRNSHIPPPKDEEALKVYNKELAKYFEDKTKRVVSVDDEVKALFINNLIKFDLKNFNINDTLALKKSYNIDLNLLKKDKYVFKYRSTFPESYNMWENAEYDFYLAGEISFTRFLFNNKKNTAYLMCKYSCGMRASETYEIYIEKKGENWIIKEKKLIAIS